MFIYLFIFFFNKDKLFLALYIENEYLEIFYQRSCYRLYFDPKLWGEGELKNIRSDIYILRNNFAKNLSSKVVIDSEIFLQPLLLLIRDTKYKRIEWKKYMYECLVAIFRFSMSYKLLELRRCVNVRHKCTNQIYFYRIKVYLEHNLKYLICSKLTIFLQIKNIPGKLQRSVLILKWSIFVYNLNM